MDNAQEAIEMHQAGEITANEALEIIDEAIPFKSITAHYPQWYNVHKGIIEANNDSHLKECTEIYYKFLNGGFLPIHPHFAQFEAKMQKR